MMTYQEAVSLSSYATTFINWTFLITFLFWGSFVCALPLLDNIDHPHGTEDDQNGLVIFLLITFFVPVLLIVATVIWHYTSTKQEMDNILNKQKIILQEAQSLEIKKQEEVWKSNSCLVYDYSCSRNQKSGSIEYKCKIKTNTINNIIGNQILIAYKTC